jgi:hypothetical protein
MPKSHQLFNRTDSHSLRHRAVQPKLEGLEERLLLYSSLGAQWTYSSRITYSFMPDGTSVGGVSSVLFQTLNSRYPTATWQQQLKIAASLWENVTNANLSQVSDSGQPVGSAGYQQDDPRFGDIRIGAVPLSSGTLAVTYIPPPVNGGTDAGDILLNSNVNWQINSNYDLMTVVAHEFGHSLGLGESTVSQAVMYGTYNGIKQALVSDDIAGIQSIYGTRSFDQFNTGSTHNNTVSTATNITSFIGAYSQIAIPNLDITTVGDTEWYYVSVPSTTNGTMTVSVQSSNLSSLSPKLIVYTSSLSLVGQAAATNSLGATISVTTCVAAGQGYYYKVMAAGGPGPIGGYGLLVNFGSQTQPPIPPPNTIVFSQPDQGGGTALDASGIGGQSGGGGGWSNGPTSIQGLVASIANLHGWIEGLTWSSSVSGGFSSNSTIQPGATTGASAVQMMAITTNVFGNGNTQAGALASDSSPAISSVLAPPTIGPAPSVLQAIDQTLDDWTA